MCLFSVENTVPWGSHRGLIALSYYTSMCNALCVRWLICWVPRSYLALLVAHFRFLQLATSFQCGSIIYTTFRWCCFTDRPSFAANYCVITQFLFSSASSGTTYLFLVSNFRLCLTRLFGFSLFSLSCESTVMCEGYLGIHFWVRTPARRPTCCTCHSTCNQLLWQVA